MKIDNVTFYTDSKVVLGYITNESRRFYVYVANPVQTIRKHTSPRQWRYIDTSENPADLATRCLNAQNLAGSEWLIGPNFLRDPTHTPPQDQEEIALDEHDPEVRKEVIACSIAVVKKSRGLGAKRFSRFSTLASLQRAIANLIVVVKEFKQPKEKLNTRKELRSTTKTNRLRNPTAKELQQAMTVIVKTVQGESFSPELESTVQYQRRPGGELS